MILPWEEVEEGQLLQTIRCPSGLQWLLTDHFYKNRAGGSRLSVTALEEGLWRGVGGGTNSRCRDQAGNKDRVASEPLGEEQSSDTAETFPIGFGGCSLLLQWNMVGAIPCRQLCATLTVSAPPRGGFVSGCSSPAPVTGCAELGQTRALALSSRWLLLRSWP